MGRLFERLVDCAIDEIARRDAAYLARFPLVRLPVGRAVERAAGLPAFSSIPEEKIAAALSALYRRLEARGFTAVEGDPDPVSQILFDSAIDAVAAEHGALPLAADGAPRPLASILAEQYDERRTEAGGRYFVRRAGRVPLLLIGASGIPLALWSRFLGDPGHEFRIVVAEPPGQDLLGGGMAENAGLPADVGRLAEVLERESPGPAGVLAWCDGGRSAIELARTRPELVRGLVLLSASLRGVAGLDQPQTEFESSFAKVIRTLQDRPALAPFLAKMLRDQVVGADWGPLADAPELRAATLFRMPAAEHAEAIRVPMSTGRFLLNHAARAAADVRYGAAEALRAVAGPILLITGDSDQIANNALTEAALARYAADAVRARISGAGHYSFDLQYPYVLLLLRQQLSGAGATICAARVTHNRLAG